MNIAAVEQLLREVGAYLLSVQKGMTGVTKADGSPVSAADQEAQRRLKGLLKILPGTRFRGEEERWSSWPATSRCWIVDPLDGTKEYLEQQQAWGISVCLVEGNEPLFGAIYFPATNILYRAERGKGVVKNGVPLSRQPNQRIVAGYRKLPLLEKQGVVKALPEWQFEPDDPSVRLIADVLEGAAAYVNVKLNTMVWDIAAGVLLIKELNGQCTDTQGQSIRLNTDEPLLPTCILSDGRVHHELLCALRKGL